MSDLNLTKCDGCGTVYGQGQTNFQGWVSVRYVPGSQDMFTFTASLKESKDYCRNCWQLAADVLPRIERPSYLKKSTEK